MELISGGSSWPCRTLDQAVKDLPKKPPSLIWTLIIEEIIHKCQGLTLEWST